MSSLKSRDDDICSLCSASSIHLCPSCSASYIMNDNLHSSCEACLGPIRAGLMLISQARCPFWPFCPWSRSNRQWMCLQHWRRMMTMAAGPNAPENFWMSSCWGRGSPTKAWLPDSAPSIAGSPPGSSPFPVEVASMAHYNCSSGLRMTLCTASLPLEPGLASILLLKVNHFSRRKLMPHSTCDQFAPHRVGSPVCGSDSGGLKQHFVAYFFSCLHCCSSGSPNLASNRDGPCNMGNGQFVSVLPALSWAVVNGQSAHAAVERALSWLTEKSTVAPKVFTHSQNVARCGEACFIWGNAWKN